MNDNRLAMDRFLASVERRAYSMAVMATSSTEDALDLVQEAMFGFVKRYKNRPENEWKPLFYRILQNKIRDWYRRGAVRRRFLKILNRGKSNPETSPDPLEQIPDSSGPDPSRAVENKDAMQALQTALTNLPYRQRQAFLLRTWEGLSVSDAACAMKCSEGSVKTHFSRALNTLREMLEDHRP
jgi:RNA polymerase sigma-70 factor (ECF subfamily)